MNSGESAGLWLIIIVVFLFVVWLIDKKFKVAKKLSEVK